MKLLKRMVPVSARDYVKAVLSRALYGGDRILPSTSSCGEDRILSYLLRKRQTGFFIDVGAYQPSAFSNTHIFYQQGWRGINIDPYPGSMEAFRKTRPRDINLEFAVGQVEGEETYYVIGDDHHQMNSLNPAFQENLFGEIAIDASKRKTMSIRVHTLVWVLSTYLPPGQVIDFMTVDVEGREECVLRSNDWNRYRPIVVMVEDHAPMRDSACAGPVVELMKSVRYSCVSKTPNELIFLSQDYRLNKRGLVEL